MKDNPENGHLTHIHANINVFVQQKKVDAGPEVIRNHASDFYSHAQITQPNHQTHSPILITPATKYIKVVIPAKVLRRAQDREHAERPESRRELDTGSGPA